MQTFSESEQQEIPAIVRCERSRLFGMQRNVFLFRDYSARTEANVDEMLLIEVAMISQNMFGLVRATK